MKLLFLFHGTTHYFNLVANKINEQPGIQVTYVYPKRKSASMGEGVFETVNGVNFELVEMEEAINSQLGYSYFVGLDSFINKTRPDVILLSDIYLRSLYDDPRLRNLIQRLNIKLVLKTIPFQLNTYDACVKEFRLRLKSNPIPSFDSIPYMLRKLLVFFKFNTFYKNYFLDKRALRTFYKNLDHKKKLFNYPHAHVNYIEEAYDIYGSYGVPKEKIVITYNSPDTDLLFAVKEKVISSAPLLPRNNFRIIHLSRLVEWKRVDMLITAVSNLKPEYPELELIVIGEGPEREKLSKLADSLKITDSVNFLGGIYDPEQLGNYLMSSSIYILAGMGGLSINDAMIFGLPVICSVCDGTEKNLVRENYNGLYFIANNQESLQSKIRILLDNPEKRLEMGGNSVKIIQNEINIHTVIAGYLKAFNYVMDIH